MHTTHFISSHEYPFCIHQLPDISPEIKKKVMVKQGGILHYRPGMWFISQLGSVHRHECSLSYTCTAQLWRCSFPRKHIYRRGNRNSKDKGHTKCLSILLKNKNQFKEIEEIGNEVKERKLREEKEAVSAQATDKKVKPFLSFSFFFSLSFFQFLLLFLDSKATHQLKGCCLSTFIYGVL